MTNVQFDPCWSRGRQVGKQASRQQGRRTAPHSRLQVPEQAQAQVHGALLFLIGQGAAGAVLLYRLGQGLEHTFLRRQLRCQRCRCRLGLGDAL